MHTLLELLCDFKAETPRIAKIIRNISTAISGCALAVMTALVTAQSQIPGWFNNIYPYLIGIPATIAFLSQFSNNE